ncbi:hypothetical protein ACIQPR_18365 [Streptomyces sp. NPDC091280]|uniref:hypothetical protein n=1 Tax=Streptomyces sp. NPDC091280 TaxID=3365984 RepID=UPI00381A4F47
MTSALDSYLGWEKPEHLRDCKRPAWDVSFRTEEKAYRHVGYGEERPKHECADKEYCGHGNSFDKSVVRIVCRSCGVARVITGEQTEDTGESVTSTKWLGYGLAPRQAAGLLLWPGTPWLDLGRFREAEPHDFVVTRLKVKEITEATVVGQISQSRGDRGGVVWTALAVPGPDGQFGYVQRIRFEHANDGRGRGGRPLRTVNAAARWIGERLAEQPVKRGVA